MFFQHSFISTPTPIFSSRLSKGPRLLLSTSLPLRTSKPCIAASPPHPPALPPKKMALPPLYHFLLLCWKCLFIPQSLPTFFLVCRGFSETPFPSQLQFCSIEECCWVSFNNQCTYIFSFFQLPQLSHNEDPLSFLFAPCLHLGMCDFPGFQGAKFSASNVVFT